MREHVACSFVYREGFVVDADAHQGISDVSIVTDVVVCGYGTVDGAAADEDTCCYFQRCEHVAGQNRTVVIDVRHGDQ